MFHADFTKTSNLLYDSVPKCIYCGIILVINRQRKKSFKQTHNVHDGFISM